MFNLPHGSERFHDNLCFNPFPVRAQDVEMSEKALFSRSEPKNVSGILNTLFTNYDKRIRPYSAGNKHIVNKL